MARWSLSAFANPFSASADAPRLRKNTRASFPDAPEGRHAMTPVLTACGGFLLAVLWMDLMFDVQVFGHPDTGAPLPEAVLASIAGYYRRATTTSQPMGRLIALVMLILLSALGFEAAYGRDPLWLLVASGGAAAIPVVLALVHTVPSAVRLGSRADPPDVQSHLARAVCRDHIVCFVCILGFVALRVAYGLQI